MAIWNQFPQLSLSFFRKSVNLSSFTLTCKMSCPLSKVCASFSLTLFLCDPFFPTFPLSQLLCPLPHYSLTLPLHCFVHFLPNFSESGLFLLLLSFSPTHVLTDIYCIKSGFCACHLTKNIFTNNFLIISHKSHGLSSDLMVPELSAAHNSVTNLIIF